MRGQRTDPALLRRAVEMRAEGASFQAVMAATGLNAKTVSRYTGTLATDASGKVRVIAALADLNGQAESVADISDKTAMMEPGLPIIDRHTVTHLLWSLNKADLVTFRETGPGKQLEAIKLTRKGWDMAGYVRHTRVGDKSHVGEVPQNPDDMTDFRTQPRTTTGGPVVRSLAVEGVSSGLNIRLDGEEPEVIETPILEVSVKDVYITAAAFPLITQVRRRKGAVEQAAKVLDDAGMEDLALELLQRGDDLNPFEREVVKLLDLFGIATK